MAYAGTRLLVSCSNSRHYLLNATQPHMQPLASFSGHVNGSFYIRACFSGDGTHILSGSSDHKAFIWEVSWQPAQSSYRGFTLACLPCMVFLIDNSSHGTFNQCDCTLVISCCLCA